MVPVHPDDGIPLSMEWNGDTEVDKVLPFGLRSAPKIYNGLVDAMPRCGFSQDGSLVNRIYFPPVWEARLFPVC